MRQYSGLKQVESYCISAHTDTLNSNFGNSIIHTFLLPIPKNVQNYIFFSPIIINLSLSPSHCRFVVPCIQLSNTFLPCLRSLCMCAVNVFISPFCMSLALCCSQIAISLSSKDWQPMRDKEAVWVWDIPSERVSERASEWEKWQDFSWEFCLK